MLTFTEISESILSLKNCPGTFDFVLLADGTNRCVLTKEFFHNYAERTKNMKIYEDDVWVITFMKSGTTWAQEIVWLLNNNLDYEGEQKVVLDMRFPYLEQNGVVTYPPGLPLKDIKKVSRPRHIKSHLPKFLLPNQLFTVKPKIIYVARNPKDNAVSSYHFYRHTFGYKGTKDEFFKNFLDNKVLFAPIHDHVLEFWKLRNEPNILFLNFEDMKRNIKQEVMKIMKFLDKSYTDDQINKLCQHVSFESMKINPSCNRADIFQVIKGTKNYISKDENYTFMREGIVGSYDKEMSEEMKAKFDEYMKCTKLIESGFSYKTD